MNSYRQQKFFRDHLLNVPAPGLAESRLRELLSQQISEFDGPQMDRWIGAVTELQRLCRMVDK